MKKKVMGMVEEDDAFFRSAAEDPAIRKKMEEELAFQKKYRDKLYDEETKKLAGKKKTKAAKK